MNSLYQVFKHTSYIFRNTAMAGYKKDLGSSFMDSFCCKICFEVLHDPVQCQNNEHYFCRKCISQHLENSETCPLCLDQLTLETLRPPSRIILEIVSQLKKPRCRHVSRGCTENVEVEDVLLHEQTCGYAPVVCLNEGCKETVNRRNQESHESEECKFRRVTCESCDEELVYIDYERHQCTLRKEINDITLRLDEVTKSLHKLTSTQAQVLERLEAYDQSIKDLQNPLRRVSSTKLVRDATLVSGQIFIFGGYGGSSDDDKSLEVFNWTTKTWTLFKETLFFKRRNSHSFLYGKRIMVCGGIYSNRIEFINPSESGVTSCAFPASLHRASAANAALSGNRLISFGETVEETQLEAPWETVTLTGENYTGNNRCGVECFGNDIFVVGDSKVERYDTVRNELKLLPSLPYSVINMATVAYKDNIIILGGQDNSSSSWQPLNDVLMYNIHTLECVRLPSMLEKRSLCAAVIMGDVIVVMGGCSGTTAYLNTVEYYVVGDSEWKELPAMNLARSVATACVYV